MRMQIQRVHVGQFNIIECNIYIISVFLQLLIHFHIIPYNRIELHLMDNISV